MLSQCESRKTWCCLVDVRIASFPRTLCDRSCCHDDINQQLAHEWDMFLQFGAHKKTALSSVNVASIFVVRRIESVVNTRHFVSRTQSLLKGATTCYITTRTFYHQWSQNGTPAITTWQNAASVVICDHRQMFGTATVLGEPCQRLCHRLSRIVCSFVLSHV
jgi:hypothetical protein